MNTLRSQVLWHGEYRPEWDTTPQEYADLDFVQWGKSRRLGMFQRGRVKAYMGVQHVDPGKPGWAIVDEPTARFFISVFLSGRVVTLKTYSTMHETLEMLAAFIERSES